jgi:hypothetical protein
MPQPPRLALGHDTVLGNAVVACVGVENPADFGGDPISYDDFEVLDEGHSVVMDGMDFGPFECLADQLQLPQWIHAQMSNTSALHGFVTVTADGLTITWAYSANTGLFETDETFVLIRDEDVS